MLEEKEFREEYKKLQGLLKSEEVTGFIGYGMLPTGKGDIFKVWDQLYKCLDYEPFADTIRKDMGLEAER